MVKRKSASVSDNDHAEKPSKLKKEDVSADNSCFLTTIKEEHCYTDDQSHKRTSLSKIQQEQHQQSDSSSDEGESEEEVLNDEDNESDDTSYSPSSEASESSLPPLQAEVFHPYSSLNFTKLSLQLLITKLTSLQQETEKVEQSIRERSKLINKMTLTEEELKKERKDYLANLYELLTNREKNFSIELNLRLFRKAKRVNTGDERMPISPGEDIDDDKLCEVLSGAVENLQKLREHNDDLKIYKDPMNRFDIDQKDFSDLTNEELALIGRHIEL